MSGAILTSDTTGELDKALAAFQRDALDPVVDSNNPHFRSRYASLKQTLTRNRKIAAQHGLSFTQHPIIEGNLAGTVLRVGHESGEWMTSTLLLPLAKATPQGVGSAITYARRYQINGVMGLAPTDDDDDGERAEEAFRARERMSQLVNEMAEIDTVEELDEFAKSAVRPFIASAPAFREECLAKYRATKNALLASEEVAS